MLDYQDFKDCIAELQNFYGGNVLNGGILEATWYESLKYLALPKLQNAIARCFKKHPRAYNFFPAADQILEFALYPERPPGECVKQNFQVSSLPSSEERMTPEQKADAVLRGRLVARIILHSTGYMTIEQKDALIEQLKLKETHELEAIASVSARSPRCPKFNNIADDEHGLKKLNFDGIARANSLGNRPV